MISDSSRRGFAALTHVLQQRAQAPADSWSFTFLDSQGAEQYRWGAPELAAKAQAIAARLLVDTEPGEPVLLVFAPGADFLAAFMGCLWSGRLATPINPPRRNRLIERLVAVATDSGARVALTSADLLSSTQEWRRASGSLASLNWIAIDELAAAPDLSPADIHADDIAFLQYTSGSTALPKGVQVSHGNLIEDMARMQAAWALGSESVMVSWLPAFHDLGLIFGVLQPLYTGCASVQMAPNAFLQKPWIWLDALSRYRGTHSAAPSFAYDLCCRRVAPEEQATLDLSSLVMTMNAAEPINPAVIERFSEQFEPNGFKRSAFAPAYGLAESTLAVTASPAGAPPVMRRFDVDALGAGVMSIADDAANARVLPGSGQALPDIPIAIVDPDTGRRCAPERVGEIWVGGPTIARGYWRRPDETAATFGCVIRDEGHAGPFLRTGDLGAVVDGELFVTGRIKDLIILGGANFYPHDIERVAQNSHAALRRDNGAAFSLADESDEGGREQIVLVQELERAHRNDDPTAIFQAIVEAVWQGLELPLSHVILVAPGTVLRTSSGKIQRLANRQAYVDGKLPIIAQWQRPSPVVRPPACEQPPPRAASELVSWLREWLADRLSLPLDTVDAHYGFAEMGLDSLGSTELAFALSRYLGVEVPETVAYDYPTIEHLATHVAGKPLDPVSPSHPVDLSALSGTDVNGDGLSDAIAVIGMGCSFPGAPDVAAFGRLLDEARNAVGAPPPGRPESTVLPVGGYVDAIDCFDAAFFGIRDGEAAHMDPQHRLTLQVAWHALEDAAATDPQRRPRATGIFLGISTHDYEARFHGAGPGFTPLVTTGNAASAAAGRLAHLLDVTGPAMAIDTACSSSLVAIHAACRSLRLGECDMAIAGGVNLLVSDDLTRGFAAAGMLSPNHACRTFDAAADGYVRGEGAGFVVLKRLADARVQGDRVRAVVRGVAVNHDGRASSLTAPNAAAQTSLIRMALADARLRPADVHFVECHGTGTPLGDPIEVQALADAYGEGRDTALLLGSVKTNIGHLEAAAGIAGLIKTVLALESGRLPPTLHQSAPNPRIKWDGLPVRVVDRSLAWPNHTPRRAGVSSFGFSGTNAHLILEDSGYQNPLAAVAPHATVAAVLPLSAPDAQGLSRLAGVLADWIEGGDIDLPAACASLALGRKAFGVRAAVVATERVGTVAALREIATGRAPATGACGDAPLVAPTIAFLFTGQGSQWCGMGKDLYEADPLFRDRVDRCARVVDPLIGQSLTAVMFIDDEADGLSDTRLAQPALFVLAYALAERLDDWGVVPDIMIGHSLGEWVAACRAGVLSLDDALALVVQRGRLMASASADGAMAAVFDTPRSLSLLTAALRERVDVAAVNAPDECVISGAAADVAAACEALDAQGVGTQRLRTAHGFHSRLMDPALAAFREAVAGVTLASPDKALVSNLTGTTTAPFDTVDYWVRQIREPVRFAEGMSSVAATGATVLIEIGASPALTGTASRAPAFDGLSPVFVPTLRRHQPAARTIGNLLAQLFVAGVPVRWERVFGQGVRLTAPGYPFAKKRHWVDCAPVVAADARLSVAQAATVEAAQRAPLSDGDEPLVDPHDEMAAMLVRSLQLSVADAQSDRGFLELGVDSLALTEAVAGLERRWSLAIPRRALFETLGTPKRLIEHVMAAVSASVALPDPSTRSNHGSANISAASAAPLAPRQSSPAPAVAPAPPVSDRMLAGLAVFSKSYTERSQASRAQRQRYGRYLADSRAVAGFRPETKAMLYPIVGASGSGSRIEDVDGNRYVDIAMGFGVQLFGHSPPFVVQAIAAHLAERGLFIGPQAHLAGDVAERLCRLTGNARAAFCNTGTEAVMTALRLARHATGRKRIAVFQGSYHGHFDGTLVQLGTGGETVPLAGGTTPGMVDDVLILDYDDAQGSLQTLMREGDSLAAVLVEPVQGRRPDRQPRAFLQRLRELTHSVGAALIFDEVLLGFRVALGGAQAWAGVRADLVTYGKIVGGGLPIGVVAGEARFLDALDGGAWSLDDASVPRGERTFFAGTFNKNPLSMVAAQAVLIHLEEAGPGLQEALNARTERFVERLNRLLANEHARISVERFSSLFRFVGASDLFYNHLIQNGVYAWEGRTCFLSTAHDDDDLDRIEAAVLASVRAMRAHELMPSAVGPEPVLMTAGQSALRMLAAFSPQTSAAYNQSLVFDFSGALDQGALRAALLEVVERHEALRTTFPDDDENQWIHRRLEPAITVVDAQNMDEKALAQWMDATIMEPVDLAAGPVVGAWVVRRAPDRHRLLLVMPHLITDGWSMQVMAHELGELYSARCVGRRPALPVAVPYRRYADYIRPRAQASEAAAYWRSVYATVPAPLNLPADRPRPALQTYTGKRAYRQLPRELIDALEAMGRQSGRSLFALCLAAYGRLLARVSGQDEAVIAVFSAGQPELAATSLVGYCLAVLPLRVAAGATISDENLLGAVQHAVLQGMAQRDYPYSALLKDLKLRRDPSRPPLASVSFNLDRVDVVPDFTNLHTVMDANVHSAVRWDLNWNMQFDADGLRIDAHYNSDMFDGERVRGWLDKYVDILHGLAGAPQVPTLADQVARAASRDPAAPALRDQEGLLSYADLDIHAATLALRLAQAGVLAGDRVAFRLARGLGPVAVMLACARLGAAFVPLDEEHPDSHHAHVLQDSGATVLVLAPGSSPAPGSVTVTVIEWSRNDRLESDAGLGATAPARVGADDVAYVLYTSGSTGRPKGVRVSYGALATYASALMRGLSVSEPTSFAMVSSFAADLGYTSVVGALWTGGLLQIVDADTVRDPVALQDWFSEMPVDALKIVPAHLAALLDAPGAAALLPRQALILGGDILTWRLVDRIRALGGACRIYNHYGPTETTIGACMTEALASLRDAAEPTVPIGWPLDGYQIALVDAEGRAVADGDEGEMIISGAALALGYMQREAPEGARFGVHLDGQRFYRTGDLGRRRADGSITFVGRSDDMVKIRGHRIEPAGIAELLRSCPRVREAVVLIDRQAGREPALLAAVSGENLARAEILDWLAARLPAAMVPARIALYAALPLTLNGKINRQALLAAESNPSAELNSSVAPNPSMARYDALGPGIDVVQDVEADASMAIICELWRQVLQRNDIGPDDDFFELGGDSIMAIQIVGRARVKGLGLTPTQVFQAPTPRGLARLAIAVNGDLTGAAPLARSVPLTPIQQWFLDTPMPNRNRWCLSAVFAAPFAVTAEALRATVHAIIARHDALRTRWDLNTQPPAQRVGDLVPPLIVTVDGCSLTETERARAEEALADQLMDSLDLQAGRILAAGAISLSGGNQARLVLVVHHALSDMVSWSILADDLRTGLAQGPGAIRAASSSWSWWADALSGRGEALAASLPYWNELARQAGRSLALPVDDRQGNNCEGDARERVLRFDSERTGHFLSGMAAVFGLRPHEAMLAVIGLALTEWSGASLPIELEGHGRLPFDPGIDLSRTVGWFTVRYPMILPAPEANNPEAWLVQVKEAMRRMPDDGISYGVLAYGAHASVRVEPEASFNFVGDLGQYGERDLPLMRLGVGRERAVDAGRRHLLSFDSWQTDAGLSLSCRFSAQHHVATIDALLGRLGAKVDEVTALCAVSQSAIYTPSDFTGMDFSQEELDQLASEFDELDDYSDDVSL